ncbi:hypothetical protein HOC35_06700 [Candidatus Woesearchaeota archaeon]|jgi:chemotaxis methyl-accepting protein methylase|nr:hypothetical protein [Candidatus Woesearchaeota archaeon]
MQSIDERISKLIKYVRDNYGDERWSAFIKGKGIIAGMDPDVLEKEFFNYGLPRSTRMFREYVASTFSQYVLPRLQEKGYMRILSMPCANGEEVFSLAMLVQEANNQDTKHDFYANIDGFDVSETQIDKARTGALSIRRVRIKQFEEYVEAGYLRQVNSKFPEPNLFVQPHITSMCEFFVHNILTQDVLPGYDVIYCMNLFLHMTSEARETALENLTLNMQQGALLIVDYPYKGIPSRLRLYGREKVQFGIQKEANEFYAFLHEKDLGLKRISTTPLHNVYEKV